MSAKRTYQESGDIYGFRPRDQSIAQFSFIFLNYTNFDFQVNKLFIYLIHIPFKGSPWTNFCLIHGLSAEAR